MKTQDLKTALQNLNNALSHLKNSCNPGVGHTVGYQCETMEFERRAQPCIAILNRTFTSPPTEINTLRRQLDAIKDSLTAPPSATKDATPPVPQIQQLQDRLSSLQPTLDTALKTQLGANYDAAITARHYDSALAIALDLGNYEDARFLLLQRDASNRPVIDPNKGIKSDSETRKGNKVNPTMLDTLYWFDLPKFSSEQRRNLAVLLLSMQGPDGRILLNLNGRRNNGHTTFSQLILQHLYYPERLELVHLRHLTHLILNAKCPVTHKNLYLPEIDAGYCDPLSMVLLLGDPVILQQLIDQRDTATGRFIVNPHNGCRTRATSKFGTLDSHFLIVGIRYYYEHLKFADDSPHYPDAKAGIKDKKPEEIATLDTYLTQLLKETAPPLHNDGGKYFPESPTDDNPKRISEAEWLRLHGHSLETVQSPAMLAGGSPATFNDSLRARMNPGRLTNDRLGGAGYGACASADAGAGAGSGSCGAGAGAGSGSYGAAAGAGSGSYGAAAGAGSGSYGAAAGAGAPAGADTSSYDEAQALAGNRESAHDARVKAAVRQTLEALISKYGNGDLPSPLEPVMVTAVLADIRRTLSVLRASASTEYDDRKCNSIEKGIAYLERDENIDPESTLPAKLILALVWQAAKDTETFTSDTEQLWEERKLSKGRLASERQKYVLGRQMTVLDVINEAETTYPDNLNSEAEARTCLDGYLSRLATALDGTHPDVAIAITKEQVMQMVDQRVNLLISQKLQATTEPTTAPDSLDVSPTMQHALITNWLYTEVTGDPSLIMSGMSGAEFLISVQPVVRTHIATEFMAVANANIGQYFAENYPSIGQTIRPIPTVFLAAHRTTEPLIELKSWFARQYDLLSSPITSELHKSAILSMRADFKDVLTDTTDFHDLAEPLKALKSRYKSFLHKDATLFSQRLKAADYRWNQSPTYALAVEKIKALRTNAKQGSSGIQARRTRALQQLLGEYSVLGRYMAYRLDLALDQPFSQTTSMASASAGAGAGSGGGTAAVRDDILVKQALLKNHEATKQLIQQQYQTFLTQGRSTNPTTRMLATAAIKRQESILNESQASYATPTALSDALSSTFTLYQELNQQIEQLTTNSGWQANILQQDLNLALSDTEATLDTFKTNIDTAVQSRDRLVAQVNSHFNPTPRLTGWQLVLANACFERLTNQLGNLSSTDRPGDIINQAIEKHTILVYQVKTNLTHPPQEIWQGKLQALCLNDLATELSEMSAGADPANVIEQAIKQHDELTALVNRLLEGNAGYAWSAPLARHCVNNGLDSAGRQTAEATVEAAFKKYHEIDTLITQQLAKWSDYPALTDKYQRMLTTGFDAVTLSQGQISEALGYANHECRELFELLEYLKGEEKAGHNPDCIQKLAEIYLADLTKQLTGADSILTKDIKRRFHAQAERITALAEQAQSSDIPWQAALANYRLACLHTQLGTTTNIAAAHAAVEQAMTQHEADIKYIQANLMAKEASPATWENELERLALADLTDSISKAAPNTPVATLCEPVITLKDAHEATITAIAEDAANTEDTYESCAARLALTGIAEALTSTLTLGQMGDKIAPVVEWHITIVQTIREIRDSIVSLEGARQTLTQLKLSAAENIVIAGKDYKAVQTDIDASAEHYQTLLAKLELLESAVDTADYQGSVARLCLQDLNQRLQTCSHHDGIQSVIYGTIARNESICAQIAALAPASGPSDWQGKLAEGCLAALTDELAALTDPSKLEDKVYHWEKKKEELDTAIGMLERTKQTPGCYGKLTTLAFTAVQSELAARPFDPTAIEVIMAQLDQKCYRIINDFTRIAEDPHQEDWQKALASYHLRSLEAQLDTVSDWQSAIEAVEASDKQYRIDLDHIQQKLCAQRNCDAWETDLANLALAKAAQQIAAAPASKNLADLINPIAEEKRGHVKTITKIVVQANPISYKSRQDYSTYSAKKALDGIKVVLNDSTATLDTIGDAMTPVIDWHYTNLSRCQTHCKRASGYGYEASCDKFLIKVEEHILQNPALTWEEAQDASLKENRLYLGLTSKLSDFDKTLIDRKPADILSMHSFIRGCVIKTVKGTTELSITALQTNIDAICVQLTKLGDVLEKINTQASDTPWFSSRHQKKLLQLCLWQADDSMKMDISLEKVIEKIDKIWHFKENLVKEISFRFVEQPSDNSAIISYALMHERLRAIDTSSNHAQLLSKLDSAEAKSDQVIQSLSDADQTIKALCQSLSIDAPKSITLKLNYAQHSTLDNAASVILTAQTERIRQHVGKIEKVLKHDSAARTSALIKNFLMITIPVFGWLVLLCRAIFCESARFPAQTSEHLVERCVRNIKTMREQYTTDSASVAVSDCSESVRSARPATHSDDFEQLPAPSPCKTAGRAPSLLSHGAGCGAGGGGGGA